MSDVPSLRLVETGELPDYPFGRDDALPGNYFLQLQHQRWLTSDLHLRGDPDVIYVHLVLIMKSQMSRPIGTIPADPDGQVALLDGKVDLRRWRTMLRCDPSPLHNWRPYRCDGGEVRLGHPVVIEMIAAQMQRRSQIQASQEADAVRKRLDRIRAALVGRGFAPSEITDDTLERIDGWFQAAQITRRDAPAYDRAVAWAISQGILTFRR